jgi:hypothetical protein
MRHARQKRGAAAVELAIMMVFLVPTFMYFLFLQDLCWYKLEMQETIVSTAWDYNFLDWNRFKMAGSGGSGGPEYKPSRTDEKDDAKVQAGVDNVVVRNSRRTYCDHTSAYDSYDAKYDCSHDDQAKDISDADEEPVTGGDTIHHTNHAAHQCWLVKKDATTGQQAKQVGCAREAESVTARSPLSSAFNNQFNNGGFITCTAKLGVTNYFLPNKFFNFWARQDVNAREKFETGTGRSSAHTDAKAADASLVFAEQGITILQDPWAVNRPAEITPDDGNMCIKDPDSRFRARVKTYYTLPSAIGLMNAAQWHLKMAQEHLLSPASMCDGLGDLLHSPPLAWKKAHQRKFQQHFASGWVDNRHQQSYNARRPHYFSQDNGYY